MPRNAAPENWSRREVEAIVADYFEMLESERRGEPVNKAEHNRDLQAEIRRSRGSIEFKHANISAALLDLGFPLIIDGYKPRYNGLGYDVLSFETDGKERLVEVKTTRFGLYTPFYASRNEVVVSQQHHRQYFIYRVCNFAKDRKLFLLNGPIEQTCTLEPVQYVASVA